MPDRKGCDYCSIGMISHTHLARFFYWQNLLLRIAIRVAERKKGFHQMLAILSEFLTRPTVLWINFLVTLALTAVFGIVMYVWGFEIIDEMYVADEILAHIAEMTALQKSVHIWLTATVDVIYPFTYGAFFIGIALKAFRRAGVWFALPSILVIPVDLFEGFAQVMLLNGNDVWIGAKTVATPTKLALFFSGVLITLAGLFKLYRAPSQR